MGNMIYQFEDNFMPRCVIYIIKMYLLRPQIAQVECTSTVHVNCIMSVEHARASVQRYVFSRGLIPAMGPPNLS